jgi:alkylated DNA repair dioxygenase AlkB
MPPAQYQQGMFDCETHVLKLEGADIEYRPKFFSEDESTLLFDILLDSTHWRQDTITVYGKAHLTPRLSSWVGESWMDYSYSNHTMKAQAWSPLLLSIKQRIEDATGDPFNSVLLNYYRDGKDSNGWHSDDEPELGREPIIASLSLGAPRDFHLRHKRDKSITHKMSLENGSLLIMRGQTQACWQHHIPKRAKAEGRLNLTFRAIVSTS